MNKIFFKGELVETIDDIEGFKISINGDNNILFLNEFKGKSTIYISIDGNNCTFSFGENNIVNNDVGINFWGTCTNKPDGSEIRIGNNNYFNGSNNSIIAPLNTKILIGDGNLFAGNITFWGRNDHIIYDIKTKKRLNKDRDILIGDSNWICQNVTFLPKGQIGNNCVVGFGSIVNCNLIKNNTLIVGVPAKIKKKKINWSRSTDYDSIDFEDNNNIKES